MAVQRSFLAFVPAMLALQSCTPPPTVTMVIANVTGQRISFTSCKGARFDLAPGESAELVDQYRFFNRETHWRCYARRPFVIRTARGQWIYKLWIHRDVDLSGDDRPMFDEFAGAHSGPYYSWYPVQVEADGTIRAGRWNPPLPDRHRLAEYPADAQPRGFPIRPIAAPAN